MQKTIRPQILRHIVFHTLRSKHDLNNTDVAKLTGVYRTTVARNFQKFLEGESSHTNEERAYTEKARRSPLSVLVESVKKPDKDAMKGTPDDAFK